MVKLAPSLLGAGILQLRMDAGEDQRVMVRSAVKHYVNEEKSHSSMNCACCVSTRKNESS